ncbi:hypothetical protein BOX15_Mlig031197g1 [Macrostomum lignano]|uniref:Bromodomain associated domain-containing protein n=1 Tax=Macrostomum lignano TaxID=282301 RepID=A0A267ELR4_9PLAT|nr:hypothetical protein BOX15_Mlig031197g1 [Macrostomum lignano]
MEQLVQSSLRIAVARLCLGHGWHSADADCVHALTDALHLYLLRLCGSVADLCELRRLQSPQLADILRALSEAGLDEPDAREYLMACAKLAPFPRAFPACPVRRPDELNWPSEAELKAESEAGDRPEHLPDHLPPRRRADAEDVEASESAADTLAVDDVDELNVTDGGKSVSVSSQAASPQKLLQQPRDCYGNRVAPSRFAMRTVAMTTDGRVVPLNSRQSGVAPSSRPPPETFRSRPRPHPDRRRTAEPLGHDWLNSGSDSEPDVGTGPGASGVGAASGVLRRGDLGTDSVGLGGDSLDNLTANAATAQSATAASDISGGGGSGDSNDSADRGVVISRRDPLGGGSGGEDGGESAAGALAAAAAAQSRFANNLDEILDNLDQVDVDSDKERDIFDFVLSGKKSAAAAVAEPRPEPPAAAAAPAAVSRKPSAARGRRKQAAISRAASAKSPPPPAAAAPSPPTPSAPVADAPGQPSPHDRFAFIGGDATDSNFSVSVGRTGGGSPDSTDTLPAVNPDDSGHRRSPTPPPSLTPSAAAAAAISPPLRVKLKLPQQPPPPQEEPLDSPSAVRHFLFDSPPRSDSKIEADDAVSPPADVDGKGEHEEAPEAEVSPADNLGGFEFDDNAVDEPFADAQDATIASAAVSPTKLSSKSGKKHRHRSPSKTPAPPPPPPHSPVAVPKLTIRLGGAFSAAVEAAPPPPPPPSRLRCRCRRRHRRLRRCPPSR